MRARIAIKSVLGLAMGLLLAGMASAAPPTPMLWKVSKGASTVYLLGSMHMLKDADYPLSPDVDDAYRHAQKLVFELPPGDMNSPATMAIALKHGMQQDPSHTLKDDLPPALWKQVTDYGAKNGLPEMSLLRFEPWMMSITILALESQKMGLDPDAGLDMHFMKAAVTDHKATSGLETVDQQLSIFYNTSIKDQDEMLRQTLDEIADFPKEMNAEHDTWRRGDTHALVTEAKKEFANYPDLYQRLVVQRNRNWIPQIQAMLDGSAHDTLVIVGALHLSGSDGVVHMLQQQGYKVDRICTGCTNVQ